MMMAESLPNGLTERLACKVLNLCRNTVRSAHRRLSFIGPQEPPLRCRKDARQPKALDAKEQQQVLDVLNSESHCNQPPIQVYHNLLQQGRYLCSVSTLHRLLRKQNLQGERRAQRAPQSNPMPRLLATAPNQVWTWDIAKLPTRKRGEYLSLYVVMDLFSRYIVAWMLSRKENSALSSQLIDEAAQRYDIVPGHLTLHQDRGAPMTASHSRPRVSNDNPMSEAQFKTLKYQPDYPRRFDHYDHAMRWCNDYVDWYNHVHHHSSLEGFTSAQVFTGQYVDIARVRQDALNEAFAAHPERFSRGRPLVCVFQTKVATDSRRSLPPIPRESCH
jgi:putative transposase